jgi:hypothetical protein
MSGLVRVDRLAPAERRRLADLEQVVERGFRTFVSVGLALSEIRDQRLYRETHKSFEDYCRERWGFNDRRASQLIVASEVSTIVGTSPPENEAQARELAPLRADPETLREAWDEVVERNPGPTAADVRQVVQRKLGVRADPVKEITRLSERFTRTLDEHAEALPPEHKRLIAADLRRWADLLDPPPPPQLFDLQRRAE